MALKRVLGATDAAWLVAGNMIGAGIFLTPGLVAGHLPGAAWHLGAWLLGAILALSGAAIYGELGARMPEAGGDYRYLSAAFGPVWGFLTGWSAFLLTFSGAAAAMAQVAVHHLARALAVDVAPDDVGGKVAASVVIVALTAANVAGARFSGRTTTVLTALPLLGLAILFGYGLLSGDGAVHRPAAPFRAPGAAWPMALGAAMLPVFFTYSGWNAAAYVAGEVRDPGRNLPRGLLVGTALVAVVYLSVNAVLLFTLPHGELAGSTTAAAVAAKRLLNPAADRVLSLFIALAILGSANVTLMAGARIYYAMASDRLAPPALHRENRAGVPSVALWVGGAWSAALALVGTVGALVEWTTLAILLLSALTVAGLFVLRRRGVGSPGYRCPAYPWVPLVYLGATLAVAVASSIRDPRQSVYGLLFVLSGVPAYLAVRRALTANSETPVR